LLARQRLTSEVVGLTLHRPEARDLPHEPADTLPMILRPIGIRHFVIFIISSDQVLEDGTTLEYLDLTATFIFVSNGRDATVGVDVKEPWLLLLMLAEVQSDDLDGTLVMETCLRLRIFYLVLETQFLQGDGYFEPVGGSLSVKCDISFDAHLVLQRVNVDC
jgi:hypothetical protein